MIPVQGITETDAVQGRIAPTASEVKLALRQILESQPFRTSKQCQDLLRYIVEHSLSGDDGSLRERIIGMEVFGRKPTYDTSEDPVVRVRAADVRKRLAQYYQSLGPGSQSLHIELQPGSYRVSFRDERPAHSGHPELVASTPQHELELPQAVTADQLYPLVPASHRRISQLRLLLIVCSVLALVATVLGLVRWLPSPWRSPQERFWAPFAASHQPTLIYLGTNAAYVFSADYLAKYRAAHGIPNDGPELFVNLPPESSVKNSDLRPVQDTFVTVGDLAATVQVATLLKGWKLPFVLRSGRDLSIGDLRNQPSVMVGAFNNPWTLELTSDLPYSFRQGVEIHDRDHPERGWTKPDKPNTTSNTDDYALITRMLTSKTGGPLVTVAGIGQFGTQAAAEFLSSPDKMRDLLKNAPAGWENKNMQAVLHIKVVGFAPVAVEVVATSYW